MIRRGRNLTGNDSHSDGSLDLYTLFLGEQMTESLPGALLTLCEIAGQSGIVQAPAILAVGLTVGAGEPEPVEAEPVEDLEFPVALE